jgi:FlaA1/EpsC-like NDP-sugar epimerase
MNPLLHDHSRSSVTSASGCNDGKGGEVFLLDMGEPVRILDIARDLIRFHNLEPDEDIPIIFTGMRPGEKMEEELLTAAEGTDTTNHEKIFIAKMGNQLPKERLEEKISILKDLTEQEMEEHERLYDIYHSGIGACE